MPPITVFARGGGAPPRPLEKDGREEKGEGLGFLRDAAAGFILSAPRVSRSIGPDGCYFT